MARGQILGLNMARGQILGLRNPKGFSDKPTVRQILDILQAIFATLDIQMEAMRALQWRLDNIDAIITKR